MLSNTEASPTVPGILWTVIATMSNSILFHVRWLWLYCTWGRPIPPFSLFIVIELVIPVVRLLVAWAGSSVRRKRVKMWSRTLLQFRLGNEYLVPLAMYNIHSLKSHLHNEVISLLKKYFPFQSVKLISQPSILPSRCPLPQTSSPPVARSHRIMIWTDR